MTDTIVIQKGDCVLRLHRAFFSDRPITDIKKVLSAALWDSSINSEAILTIDGWLEDLIEVKKAEWSLKGKAFTDGYRDPVQHRNAKMQNNKLIAAVRTAEKHFERQKKIAVIWRAMKEV